MGKLKTIEASKEKLENIIFVLNNFEHKISEQFIEDVYDTIHELEMKFIDLL